MNKAFKILFVLLSIKIADLALILGSSLANTFSLKKIKVDISNNKISIFFIFILNSPKKTIHNIHYFDKKFNRKYMKGG